MGAGEYFWRVLELSADIVLGWFSGVAGSWIFVIV